jgi:hypothetical protein
LGVFLYQRIDNLLKKGLLKILTLFLLVVLSGRTNASGTAGTLLGDESDGSRAQPAHLIDLFAENIDPNTFEPIKGDKINPNVDEGYNVLLPFSMKWTCGECHSYNIISKGWHFNAAEPNVPPGRLGQPWIYFDARTVTQIPLSYRAWPGAFRPEQVGLTGRKFTQIFGRQMPGGGVGEHDAESPEERMRQYISGKLEVNCLACHNADPGQDQGGTYGYAVQVARGNFRWAAAGASGFASVTGSAEDMPDTYDPFDPFEVASARQKEKRPPAIIYRKAAFDSENRLLFNIAREVPLQRCYYCHSNLYLSDTEKTEKWSLDEDVHLKAGLTCVDCHRNGLEHNIVRGYAEEILVSQNPLAATSSCEGCHLSEGKDKPLAGRLGAPVPKHPGIPPIHFEKLTCTACHCGPWPGKETIFTKTSRAHRLGTPNVNKSKEVLPHILSPVFAKQHNPPINWGANYLAPSFTGGSMGGKIAPYKLIWPAFWAELVDKEVKPISLDVVKQTVGEVFADLEMPQSGDWPSLSTEHIAGALVSLQKAVEAKAVYVAGGNIYSLDDKGALQKQEGHPSAKPYLWPIAHDVRPAAQSLGARSCRDCHATDSPFFFGNVTVDSPIAAERKSIKKMVEFEGLNAFYAWVFAFSFVFRPWLKVIAVGSCAILAGILLLYALKALACVTKALGGEDK